MKEGLCLCANLLLDLLVKGKRLSAHSVRTYDGFVSGHDDGSGVVTHADSIYCEVCFYIFAIKLRQLFADTLAEVHIIVVIVV